LFNAVIKQSQMPSPVVLQLFPMLLSVVPAISLMLQNVDRKQS